VVISRSELRGLEVEAREARNRAKRLAMENAGLVKTNANLREELTTAQATIARLETQVTGLVTLGDNLQKQLADLKSRLNTDSRNASKPPSSDGPEVPGRGGRGKSTGRLVHPTNNLAERLLRYAVIYRKLSFGTDSAKGSRYLERLLTTAATLSLQNRNLFGYLTDGMTASFAGKPAPSLLPASGEA